MSHKTRNTVLLVLIVVLAGLAVWTMLPASSAKVNDLGYFSMCPFAPWSTLALLMAAGGVWAIRQYFLSTD
jgi:hypothetical protein